MNATPNPLPARAAALVFALTVTFSLLAGVDALANPYPAAAAAMAHDTVSCTVRG
jgi:hypothetical protein